MSKRVVVLYPFYSQQHKGTGKFLFRSCGSTKILRFIGEQLLRDSLADVIRFVAPESQLWEDDLSSVIPSEWIYSSSIPADNRLQRLTWPVWDWDYIFRDADLVFNMHELVGWPLKFLYPKTKVISMFTVAPTAEPWPWMRPLIDLSFYWSDLVTVPSQTMENFVRETTVSPAPITSWPLSFDQEELDRLLALPPSGKPLVDVLFVFRASASNYTHHREFIQALRLLSEWWKEPGLLVAFTDTTHYLREHQLEDFSGEWGDKSMTEILRDPGDQEAYTDLLRRSRVVVGMNDNMHGGMGVREAMYAGAVPVLLDAPCYRELLDFDSYNRKWPVWIPNPVTSRGIASALSIMLDVSSGKASFYPKLPNIQGRAAQESFQYTWKTMKPVITGLLEKGA